MAGLFDPYLQSGGCVSVALARAKEMSSMRTAITQDGAHVPSCTSKISGGVAPRMKSSLHTSAAQRQSRFASTP